MFDGDLLAERARVTPDKLALVSVETGERLTYAELNARAEAAAAHLHSLGLAPGDRFGVLGENRPEFLAQRYHVLDQDEAVKALAAGLAALARAATSP